MRTTSHPRRSVSGTGARPDRQAPPVRARVQAALGVRAASEGLVARGVSVRPSDVVFVKSLLEDSEGLACIFAERGGELVLAAPPSRAADLDALCADLEREIGARIVRDPFAAEDRSANFREVEDRSANPHETEGFS